VTKETSYASVEQREEPAPAAVFPAAARRSDADAAGADATDTESVGPAGLHGSGGQSEPGLREVDSLIGFNGLPTRPQARGERPRLSTAEIQQLENEGIFVTMTVGGKSVLTHSMGDDVMKKIVAGEITIAEARQWKLNADREGRLIAHSAIGFTPKE
jgi:hypothetical protein